MTEDKLNDTAKLYEELRSITDGNSESFTHTDAVQYLKDVLAQPEQEFVAWVGLTGAEVNHIFAANVGYPERMMKEVEAKLKEKNGD